MELAFYGSFLNVSALLERHAEEHHHPKPHLHPQNAYDYKGVARPFNFTKKEHSFAHPIQEKSPSQTTLAVETHGHRRKGTV